VVRAARNIRKRSGASPRCHQRIAPATLAEGARRLREAELAARVNPPGSARPRQG
jgi:hypothetical protein